jgi:hypothetical protein
MSELTQTIAELTFAYADREAKWLNRYNRLQPNGSLALEWGYKEAFYQSRFVEMLRLLPDEHLESMLAIIRSRLAALPGSTTSPASPDNHNPTDHPPSCTVAIFSHCPD